MFKNILVVFPLNRPAVCAVSGVYGVLVNNAVFTAVVTMLSLKAVDQNIYHLMGSCLRPSTQAFLWQSS